MSGDSRNPVLTMRIFTFTLRLRKIHRDRRIRRDGWKTLNIGADHDDDELLAPGAAAKMFGVDPRTVRDWNVAGKISAVRTLGGHRRYRGSEIRALIAQAQPEAIAS